MTASLTHRERVLRSIAHGDIDRVASFFFAEADVRTRICEELNLPSEAAILDYFDVDTARAWAVLRPDATPFPDLSGIKNAADVDAAAWPGAFDVDVDACAAAAAEARVGDRAVVGGIWASIFTVPRRSMGESRFLQALIDEPELVNAIVSRTAEAFIEQNGAYLGACAADLDIYFFGSDFGTQRAMFISPAMFRRFFKPHMRRIVEHAKGFGLHVMYHTCGAISDIIPDLIEIGVELLDPVQVSAHNMAPESLAARFRGRVTFHGGISTQTVLPNCLAEEVYEVTRHTIATLGPTGYICGPDQYMIGDIPTANIAAMYRAVHDFAI